MPLARGTKLGPYQIESPIGAGGMGEVYKATDTRLERTVAIKVLPAHVASDPERKSRFEREAKTVAALSHPHICPVFDVGREGETDFLVMEYLEGETLADRLSKGALPLDQALRYAIEIADALDKAHRQGVTHRDLKPANIMLTKAGAKLLDFGLAKLKPTGPQSDASTKLADALTQQGTILGTLPYMSPEQLEGKQTDTRTDIFAFGAVVYEMVTGKRAFDGETQASLIGAILKDAPRPVSALQPMSPVTLDRVVGKCLEKDPEGRWHSAHDLHDELTWITQGDTPPRTARPTAVTQPRLGQTKTMTWGVVVGAMGVALLVAVPWNLGWLPSGTPGSMTRLIVALSPADRLGATARASAIQGGGSWPVTVSRDGTQLAYIGAGDDATRLYIRDLADAEGRAVRDSAGARGPFFSPDGAWVGFFADGMLKKVSVRGGTPITLCEAPSPRGGSWSEDDVIVFAPLSRAGLSLVSANGGTPEPVTELDTEHDETSHRLPMFLPGGTAVVFVAEGTGRDARVVVQSLETGERRVVVEEATLPRYSVSGHLLYVQGGTSIAAPFDLARLELLGPGVPVLPDEATLLGLSDTGTLVYLAHEVSEGGRQLVWVTRDGQEELLAAPARDYGHPRLSPDGHRVAVNIDDSAGRNIWVYDIDGETPLTRLTFDGAYAWPVWKPDGVHVSYGSNQPDTGWDIHWTRADGSGTDEVLWATASLQLPSSWAPDGQTLAFRQIDPSSGLDIWLFTLDGNTSRPWLQTAAMESYPAISPNGQWVAYVSNESGPREVYVRPLSGSGQYLVSTDGGVEPVWSRDGRELFYWNGDQLYVVGIGSGETFQRDTPVPLFERAHRAGTFSQGYDVAPDGQRFLIVTPEEQTVVSQLDLVQNWFTELERLVPTP